MLLPLPLGHCPEQRFLFPACVALCSGLPTNVTEEQVAQFFGQIGMIKIDKKRNKPKVRAPIWAGSCSCCACESVCNCLAMALLSSLLGPTPAHPSP